MLESWTEVLVLAPVGWEELVAETLAVGPCTSVAFGRPSLGTDEPPAGFEYVRTYLAEESDTPELRAHIEATLAALADRAGEPELVGLHPRFRRLPPEDFATSWRKVWKPFRVGRLVIVPPDRRGDLRGSDRELVFEPRSAFGTGRHCSTRACLTALQERVGPGERVLDAGTGSGILAVASVLVGAGRAVGFDLDPVAPGQARALAEANGVAERCEFRAGGFEVLGAEDFGYDGVLANLYADLIREHAAELARRMRPGAWFCFAGCTAERLEPTRTAVEDAGLAIDEVRARGRWRALLGTALPPPGGA